MFDEKIQKLKDLKIEITKQLLMCDISDVNIERYNNDFNNITEAIKHINSVRLQLGVDSV